jgi:hypothetical protein
MGTLSKRTTDVVAGTVGDSITPFATSLLASAAVVTGHPELLPWSVPAGAFAGALGQQGCLLVTDVLKDRVNRIAVWLHELTLTTGQPAEDFIAEHARDGQQRDFLGHLIDVVANSRDAWKIEVLAKAYARGAQDSSIVDETLFQVELLKKLDGAHVRYLAALLDRIESKKTNTAKTGIGIGQEEILAADPGLRPASPFIHRTLTALDLIGGNAPTFHLTDLGLICCEWLEALGAEASAKEQASGG